MANFSLDFDYFDAQTNDTVILNKMDGLLIDEHNMDKNDLSLISDRSVKQKETKKKKHVLPVNGPGKDYYGSYACIY